MFKKPSGTVYDDDGSSTAYVSGDCAWTDATWTRTEDGVDVILKTRGVFSSATKRDYVLALANAPPLTSAVDGSSYDGASLTLRVPLKAPGLKDGDAATTSIPLSAALLVQAAPVLAPRVGERSPQPGTAPCRSALRSTTAR